MEVETWTTRRPLQKNTSRYISKGVFSLWQGRRDSYTQPTVLECVYIHEVLKTIIR